jgi:ubiquitin C-terminal hydrolase
MTDNNKLEFDNILLGIDNIGNTCYINSLTQCLINTESFRLLLLDDNNLKMIYYNILNKNKNLIKNDSVDITKMNVILNNKISYHLIRLFNNYINNKKINPRNYIDTICKNSDIFELGQEDDVQELYILLINKFKEELKDEIEIDLNKNIIEIYGSLEITDEIKDKLENLKKEINKDFSRVTTPFLSISDTVIKCECEYIAHTFDIPIQLQLNLIKKDKEFIDINDCLDDYFNEIICEEFKCTKCNQITEVKKKEQIWLPPQILVIHLKRFVTSINNGIYNQKKIHTNVIYEEILDMSKYIINKSREYKYELYAISNHYGTMNNGHYYSYIKKNNIWYNFNDEKVSKLNNNDHINNEYAYLLFYRLYKN